MFRFLSRNTRRASNSNSNQARYPCDGTNSDCPPSYQDATIGSRTSAPLVGGACEKSATDLKQQAMCEMNEKRSKSEFKGSSESTDSVSLERGTVTGFKQELEILRYYDTVILVDDSSSMVGGRWREARNALATLSEIAMAYDQDGIDIYFLNEPTKEGQNITCPEAVESLFEKVKPWGWTPIAGRLRELTGEYMQGLREASQAGVKTKPVNYIVITDGVPTDHDQLPTVIMNLAMALENGRYTNNQLGIQFVQVGNDRWATQYLQNLDGDIKYYDFPRDIVDASPYSTGETLTGEKILKILKGAIDRRLDNSGSVGRSGSRTIQSY